jgi:hypothetical protein
MGLRILRSSLRAQRSNAIRDRIALQREMFDVTLILNEVLCMRRGSSPWLITTRSACLRASPSAVLQTI